MRTLSPLLAAQWFNVSQDPVYVASLQFETGNTIFITSHTISGLSGADVYDRFLLYISGTTARIEPEEGRSSIGNISVHALDVDGSLCQRIAAEDAAGNGLRYKVVKIYFGLAGMSWSDFNTANDVIQTQIVNNVSVDQNELVFDCSDVQRTTRKNIFSLAKTKLTASINATTLLIPVASVSGSALSPESFQRMYHGPTFTDAPGQEVGYITIDNEIIRWTSTTVDGTLGLCFVADKRGALNTIPAQHDIPTSSNDTNGKEVSEIMYLEMPAVEAMYGIMTGSYYSQPGKFFPDGWHLAIPGEFIRTSDFLNVGADLWNGANGGFICRFVGENEQDAKNFMGKQLALLASVTPIPYPNGEIGVKRLNNILHTSPYVFTLDHSNIISQQPLRLNYSGISNLLSVEWNYDPLRKILTRQKILIDTVSRAKYENAPEKMLQFRGLHGSRHSTTTIEGLFDRLRDRYAGPPYYKTVTCQPWCGHLEIGDVVRLVNPSELDPLTGESFDRAMEIQQVSIDWITGLVTFELCGSAMPSTAITPEDPNEDGETPGTSIIPDAAYTALGTNLATYPGVTIVPSGGVGHITAGSGLVGGDTLDDGRYYYDGDLELDAGVVLPFTKNVQLWVKGHIQINGTLDGSARGQNGGAMISTPPFDYNFSTPGDVPFPFDPADQFELHNPGLSGYIGPTVSDGGFTNNPHTALRADKGLLSVPGHATAGLTTTVPAIQISYSSNKVVGVPSVLWGTSGATGRATSFRMPAGYRDVAGGGGGKSGAGILFVSRGADFGASGKVITNGEDGFRGESTFGGSNSDPNARVDAYYAGSGAGGAPGAVLFVVDGLINSSPTLQNVEAKFGANPIPIPRNTLPGPWGPTQLADTVIVTIPGQFSGNPGPYYGYYRQPQIDMSGIAGGASRILYIPPVNVPSEDEPTDPGTGEVVAGNATAITLTEYTDTPRSAAGNLSSIEVTVTPPSPLGAYRYANIYYRVDGQEAWTYGTAASHEGVVVVPTDGTTYEFEARSISTQGAENLNGIRATITVRDVINPPNDDDDTPGVLPVPNIRGLEIVGQGNVTDFSGPNVTLVWRMSTLAEWENPLTSLRQVGHGSLDLYFSHYEIEIYDTANGELLRRVNRMTPQFTYDLSMNEEDSANADARAGRAFAGVRRQVTVHVYQWSRQNLRSASAAVLTVQNPAPAGLTAVSIQEGALSAKFSYARPDDADFRGVELWVDSTPGFTPTDANRIHKGADSSVDVFNLTHSTTYYLRYRPFDDYGAGTLSDELAFTTGMIEVASISGLSAWATRIDPADAAFINAQLTGDAIESTKIANLTVAKLTAGVLQATITIGTLGNIVVTNGSYVTTIGIHNVSGTNYAIRTYDGATSSFSVTDNGILRATGAIISGAVTITGGSGYANLSDRPVALSDINSTEGTKLSGVAVGATANLSLVAGANVTVVGNKITKVSGSGSWNAQAYSKESYTGSSYVTFTVDQNNIALMVALNTDPTTDADFASLDYAIYLRATGDVHVYNSGTGQGQKSASYAAGDVFSIVYDGSSVTYYQNGTSIFSQAVSSGQKFYMDSSFSGLGSVSAITFGPLTVGSTASLNAGVTITGGGITMSAGGSVKGGKTAPGSGTGFFLGYSSGVYQLDVGDTTNEKYMHFNGTDLVLGANTGLLGVAIAGSSDIGISRESIIQAEYTEDVTDINDVSWSATSEYVYVAAVFGSAINSYARTYFTRGSYVIGNPSWSKDATWTCFVGLTSWVAGIARSEGFVGSGNWSNTSEANHIGFVYKSATGTFISCGTGSARTETNISSSFLTGTMSYKKRGSTVSFYHNGSLVGTITTNLPTGTTDAKLHHGSKCVRTVAGGGSPAIYFGEWRYLQKE